MITYEHARAIAEGKIRADCALMDECILEKPYGWYFCYQSKTYLRTRNVSDLLVGSGGFIVSKENGAFFEFGSGRSLQQNFAAYESGFKYESYDLVIRRVNNLAQTIDFLMELPIYYVIPELEHGVEWKIPRPFTEAMFEEKLSSLPSTFSNLKLNLYYEIFLERAPSNFCEYEMVQYTGA
jgi:hypothetical protein